MAVGRGVRLDACAVGNGCGSAGQSYRNLHDRRTGLPAGTVEVGQSVDLDCPDADGDCGIFDSLAGAAALVHIAFRGYFLLADRAGACRRNPPAAMAAAADHSVDQPAWRVHLRRDPARCVRGGGSHIVGHGQTQRRAFGGPGARAPLCADGRCLRRREPVEPVRLAAAPPHRPVPHGSLAAREHHGVSHAELPAPRWRSISSCCFWEAPSLPPGTSTGGGSRTRYCSWFGLTSQ